jgi:hypothetical protein
MSDPLDDLHAYERQTIVLRLDYDEARDLVSILALVSLSDPLKERAVLLTDKVASECFEHHARRFA